METSIIRIAWLSDKASRISRRVMRFASPLSDTSMSLAAEQVWREYCKRSRHVESEDHRGHNMVRLLRVTCRKRRHHHESVGFPVRRGHGTDGHLHRGR